VYTVKGSKLLLQGEIPGNNSITRGAKGLFINDDIFGIWDEVMNGVISTEISLPSFFLLQISDKPPSFLAPVSHF
jgi:hypothetical protein